MERDLTASQTRKKWEDYYSSIGDPSAAKEFETEYNKYVGTHTWHNSVRIISSNGVFQPGSKVLDAGCGWGRLLLGITDQFDGLNISAVDQSTDALELGKNVLGETRHGNRIEWRSGDLHSLPYEDESFDTVYSARVFQHLNSPSQAARELIRVLKPKGRFLVIVQNKLCPMNITYYSRIYSPRSVLSWFDEIAVSEINATTMDFYPTKVGFPHNVESRMNIESTMEKLPLLRWIGGKVVVSGVK